MKHHLHSVIVSYNRRELTARAISSYFETVSMPFSLVVVDNGSTDDSRDFLIDCVERYNLEPILLDENRYPGYATNRGWEKMPEQTTLLHRADNDFIFLPGWCDEIRRIMRRPDVGQIGLRTAQEEQHCRTNVGGNNVIRRKLWDLGLRYDERPWDEFPTGYTEDSYFTPEVVKLNYAWRRVERPCIVPTSREDLDDPYYQETWGVRGILPGT